MKIRWKNKRKEREKMQIEKFYAKDKKFYAHKSNKPIRRETLKEHTDLCCDYFQKIFPKENYESFGII